MINTSRIPLSEARDTAAAVVELLRPHCEKIEIAGSIRRKADTVKDAEVVILPLPGGGWRRRLDELVAAGEISKALYGEKQSPRWGEKYRGLVFQGLRVEVFAAEADSWGYQLWLRTGPGDANQFIMAWLKWRKAPVQAKEGAWWHGTRRLCIPDEAAMFRLLGMPYIRPGFRCVPVYRQHTNSRAHQFPDFTTFYAQEAKTLELPGVPRARMFEGWEPEEAGERAAARRAEQAYHRAQMARWAAGREAYLAEARTRWYAGAQDKPYLGALW